MPTERSLAIVAELTDLFNQSSLILATDYRGMNVSALQEFRKSLRESGAQFKVAKGTLAKISAENAGIAGLNSIVEGPIGFITISSDHDPSQVTKTLFNYIQTNRIESLKVKGGMLSHQPLTEAQVIQLSKLPPKEELLAKLMGLLNAPAYRLVSVLQAPSRYMLAVISAYKEKLENPA